MPIFEVKNGWPLIRDRNDKIRNTFVFDVCFMFQGFI